MGLRPGESVGIIGDNCPEWVLADMAVQCAGGVSVGIYATNAWQQVQFVVNHAETTYLFVENEEQLDKWLMFKDKAPALKKVIVWDTEGLHQFDDPMVMSFDDLMAVNVRGTWLTLRAFAKHMLPRHAGEMPSDVFRFSFQRLGGHHRVGIAPSFGFHAGCIDGHGIVPDDEVLDNGRTR